MWFYEFTNRYEHLFQENILSVPVTGDYFKCAGFAEYTGSCIYSNKPDVCRNCVRRGNNLRKSWRCYESE